jgi:hypothetical protein
MCGGAAAEAFGTGPFQHDSSLWSPVNEPETIGADLGTEDPGIYPPIQDARGIDAGQTVDAGIESIRCANCRGNQYLPRCRVSAANCSVRVQLRVSIRDTERPFHSPPLTPSDSESSRAGRYQRGVRTFWADHIKQETPGQAGV